MFNINPFRQHRANNEVLKEDPTSLAKKMAKDEGYGGMVSPETKARVDAKVPAPKQDPKTAKLQKKIDGMKKMKKESIGKTAGDHGYYHLQKAKELAKKDGHDYDKLPQYDRTHDKHKDHYDSKAKKESVKSESVKYHIPEDIPANERTAFHGAAAAAAKDGKKNFSFGGKTHPVTMKKDTATKIADQKESFIGEEHSKTNKASMTIKHGYDEGDGPDNKKFAKHVNKTTGATVKHHKDGSTMSFHGSDHQIHKALQIHHSDDKKGLGDLNYHKKGKTHSDDHVDGQHTYKAEGTTFRERLMSIFESDRAAHYKGATKPEEYDEKQKSSKGAMDMMKTPKSVEADGMKAAKDTAVAIKKSAPGKKMRKGDQNKGDLNIKPSATPVKDPSAKIITAEEYGMFGKKISNSLLDSIAMVEDMNKVHTVDIDHMTGTAGSHEKKHGITLKKSKNYDNTRGMMGTNATGTKANLQKYLKKHYDGDHKEMHPEIYK